MRYPFVLGLASGVAGLGLLLLGHQPGAGRLLTAKDTGHYCETSYEHLPSGPCELGDWLLTNLDAASQACDFARQIIKTERGSDILCHYVGHVRTLRTPRG
jgi:hypothetical protein